MAPAMIAKATALAVLLGVTHASTLGQNGLDRKCATACVGAYCNPAIAFGGVHPIQNRRLPMAGPTDGRWVPFVATDESKSRPWPNALGVADTSKFVSFNQSSNDTSPLTYLPVTRGDVQAGPFDPNGEFFWFRYEKQLCLGYPMGMTNNSMDGTLCQRLPFDFSYFWFADMSLSGGVMLLEVRGKESMVAAATRREDGTLDVVATPCNGSAYLTKDGSKMVFQTDNKVCTGVISEMTSQGNSTEGVTCLPIKNPYTSGKFQVQSGGINGNGSLLFYGAFDNDNQDYNLQCVIDTQNGNSLCTEESYRLVWQNGMGDRFGVFTVVLSTICVTDLAGATGGTGRVMKAGVLGASFTNCTAKGAINTLYYATPPQGKEDNFVLTVELLQNGFGLPTVLNYIFSPALLTDQSPLGGKSAELTESGELSSTSYMPLGGWSNRSAIAQWWTKHPDPALNATVGQICTQKVVFAHPSA